MFGSCSAISSTLGKSSSVTEMHSACVTRFSRMRVSSSGKRARRSGKLMWQCESTNIE